MKLSYVGGVGVMAEIRDEEVIFCPTAAFSRKATEEARNAMMAQSFVERVIAPEISYEANHGNNSTDVLYADIKKECKVHSVLEVLWHLGYTIKELDHGIMRISW